jgi:hypothetical protein
MSFGACRLQSEQLLWLGGFASDDPRRLNIGDRLVVAPHSETSARLIRLGHLLSSITTVSAELLQKEHDS